MEALTLHHVTRHFQDGDFVVLAVNGVDITLESGEFSALAGPSGSGKTTLLNLVGGLDRPTDGYVSIGGISLSDRTDNELTEIRLRKIGFVFQAYNLIPVLTAYENIQFVLHIQGVPEK